MSLSGGDMMGQRGQAKRREQTGHFTMYSNAEELNLVAKIRDAILARCVGGRGDVNFS